MVHKRSFLPDDGLDVEEVPVQDSKRQLTFENAARQVVRGSSTQELDSTLEPFLRLVVREEVERVIRSYMPTPARCTVNRMKASGSRGWQLHFRNKLPSTIFTGNRIKAKDNTTIKIVILATNSGKIVTTGPLSSIKVEILVLYGGFGSDDQEDWAEEDFNASVVCEREGKRPLITGDLIVTLKDGVGYIGDITVTDNSSWTRSRTFRLGAKVVQGTCNRERVREARSEAFVVKDKRGESYKKHHPPTLGDEVWRLERISKDGVFHNLLASYRIDTVQEFLRLLIINPYYLRSILGKGMSNKKWDVIIKHAKSCTVDNKQYFYHKNGQQVGLLFDSIYKVVGATFDGCSFLSLDKLSSNQMSLVEIAKQDAYQNLNDISEIVCPSVDVSSTALQILDASFEGSSLDEHIRVSQVKHQDGTAPQVSLCFPPNLSSCILEDHIPSEDAVIMQGYRPMQRNSFKERSLLTNYINDGNEWISGGPSGPVVLEGPDISQIQMPNWFAWEQGNGIFLASGDESGIDLISSLPDLAVHKPNMGWFKLRAALKFCQGLAARRAKVPHFGY